jgi:fibronectin-binding autotransporter adhesin
MADRFWVGGSGTWNTSSTTNWSASSGGASGASVPTAADSVFFDQAGTYTVTTTGALTCLDFTVSAGTVAFTNVGAITVSGSMSLLAGTTWGGSMSLTFNATTTGKTVTTNGTTFGLVSFNGSGGGWTLGSSLTCGGNLSVINGTFDTSSVGNYAVSCTQFLITGTSTRTVNLNASTISCISASSTAISAATITGLTFNAGTSQINITASGTGGISSGGLAFYNVAFTGGAGSSSTRTITGANTFNNLAFTAPASAGLSTVTFAANQTINGTLSTTGTAGNRRVFFASATYGIGYTLTVNSAASLTDADFRDLYVIGTAAPISGTRIGDLRGCSGITFSTPKTVYWNLAAGGNWSANAWATSSGGSVSTDNFPLAQDTATIVNTGLNTGATLTWDDAIPYLGSINMSARTNAMTFFFSVSRTAYGNWTNGSGTTVTNNGGLILSGRNTQIITSAGKVMATNAGFIVDTYGGTVQLADALNLGTNNLVVTNGTFTTVGFAVTCGTLSSTNSNVRTINLGASTVTLQSNTVINFGTSTNLTFNAGTSSIVCSASAGKTFATGGFPITFYDVSFTSTASTTIQFSGSALNTFNSLSVTPTASAGIVNCIFTSNIVVNGTLTCAGASAVRRVFLQSDTIGTQRTLTAAAISADDCDFRDIVLAGAAAGASPTRAGDCGNNSGITFSAPKTVYWNLGGGARNWSDTGWCTASGGTPALNNFPLAQDTAVFDNAGSVTSIITMNAAWNIGTFDASLRTSAMTLTIGNAAVVYGDWKFGTGVTSGIAGANINFSKNGTQTITSNGVQFNSPVQINNPNAYVQLADALSLVSTSTLTLTGGTFDAVTYNVTTGLVNCQGTGFNLKMGSGTWTLSGTGAVWNMAAIPVITAGTSTIVLSDTSTFPRTFAGSSLYYNKLTIGGTTGTSTLTITASNTFGELASTKTVAHTVLFQATLTHTVGKWAVTGTVGNVVTVSSNLSATAFTLSIVGPANSGIDYLSIRDCTVATTSPGEFYVGANSTNVSNNTRVVFTATPTPRNLYWVGGTGNWSSTTKWATSSGGVSGADIPTSLDTVTFDSLSNATAYTATIDAGVTIARCAAFTMAGPLTGNVTFAGTVQIAFHGNVSFAATGITRSYTGAMGCAGNSSYTFTPNGLVFNSSFSTNGIGATWTLGSALNIQSSFLLVTYGSFSTSASNYAITAATLSSSNTNIRSIFLNGSTVTLNSNPITFTQPTNLAFNAGTSLISASANTPSFFGGGQTFYNVTFTNVASFGISFTGINTFNNLTFTGQTTVGINPVTFSANQTINGTLTLGAGTASAYRTFLASDTIGTPRTLTVNALAAGAADIDFRDIVVTGAAAPLTGTRFGDCKGNSGITFPAAKTVYYRATGANTWATSGAGNWSATSGGAADATMFPLAQDTAVFPSATYPASGITTTIANNHNIGTIDMSLRTSNTMTLATGSTTPQIYGNWINGTGITLTGTGAITFAGRGSQTITSAGRTFTQDFVLWTPGGSITLLDAFISNRASGTAIQQIAGTFNANGYNVTLSSGGFFSNSTLTRTAAVGSGTWILGSNGTVWTSNATNLTVTGTGTISLTSASAKQFSGGSISYSGITLNQGGAGALTITGNNTFANITDTAAGATTINLGATTQTVGAFTAAGTAGNLLTITGTSAGSPATLIYSGSGVISGVDYVVPTFVRAYPTTSTWYVGSNSTNGGSLGFIFAPYVPPSTGINGQFFAFF